MSEFLLRLTLNKCASEPQSDSLLRSVLLRSTLDSIEQERKIRDQGWMETQFESLLLEDEPEDSYNSHDNYYLTHAVRYITASSPNFGDIDIDSTPVQDSERKTADVIFPEQWKITDDEHMSSDESDVDLDSDESEYDDDEQPQPKTPQSPPLQAFLNPTLQSGKFSQELIGVSIGNQICYSTFQSAFEQQPAAYGPSYQMGKDFLMFDDALQDSSYSHIQLFS